MRKGRDSGICAVSDLDPLGFRLERGFDSLHSFHFYTLHSEQFIDAIECSGDFNYHNGFNEPHLRYDAPTLCSDLCDSATIDGSAVAASVDCSIALFFSDKSFPLY